MAGDDYVLDTSALIASFYSEPFIERLIADADEGRVRLYLPTVAMADAEQHLQAGVDGWAHLLYCRHIEAMPLSETCAVEIGDWPGALAVRQTAYEARALRATVVTREPRLYSGFNVPIRPV
jgi:hypothetical protein